MYSSQNPENRRTDNYSVVEGVLNVTSLIQGDITLAVAGVDLAGNKDPAATVLSIVVVSKLPDTVITTPPPGVAVTS